MSIMTTAVFARSMESGSGSALTIVAMEKRYSQADFRSVSGWYYVRNRPALSA
jgi:hypothetical protein